MDQITNKREIDQILGRMEQQIPRICSGPLTECVTKELKSCVKTLEYASKWLLDQVTSRTEPDEAMEIHGYSQRATKLGGRIEEYLKKHREYLEHRAVGEVD